MIAPGTFSWVKNNEQWYKSQYDMKEGMENRKF